MNMPVRDAGDVEPYLDSAVLNAFPAGVLVCNARGVIVQGNTELHRLFGYDDNELLGQSLATLLPEGKRQEHQALLEMFFADAKKRSMGMGRDLLGQRKDGTTFPLEIGLNPIMTPSGQQVIATVADISNRQRLERNFEKIVEAAPIGMLIVDSRGIIKHANRQIEFIFGCSIDEIKNKPLEMLVPERYRSQHRHHRAAYTDQPVCRVMGLERDLTGLHKNGTEFPVEIGLNPIEANNEIYIVATVTDITQRKKSELKLKQANADLDEFTYVASHDLKSPLRGIGSLIEWIEEDLGDSMSVDVRNNIDRIHIRIQRMERLVDDLLAYARSSRQHTDARNIKVQEILDNTLQLVGPPEGFKIEMTGYLGEIFTPVIPLETVLRNIISNAVKHHDRDHGEIKVNVTIENSFCIFDIEDDGPGIPQSAHERIFKLFQTLSNDEKSRSGVGLAVCKRMVESHGGKIEVHSQEGGRGTRFRFWWPRFSRRDING